jgi:hypothetical protein
MKCAKCESEIPQERLEVLPHTKTCVECSTEQKRVGFMCFEHKTAPFLVMVDSANKETLRQANRAFRRAR